MDFEAKVDLDATFFECSARHLASELEALRELAFYNKETSFDLIAQQWPRSKKEDITAAFAIMQEDINAVRDKLSSILYYIRVLKALGRTDPTPGTTHMEV